MGLDGKPKTDQRRSVNLTVGQDIWVGLCLTASTLVI